MIDYENYSPAELIGLLGERFHEYRMRMQLTQEEVAQRTGLSVSSIRRFESGGTGNLSLSTFLTLLKSLGRLSQMDHVLPELPESPYLVRSEKKQQRIRHRKQ